MGELRDFQVGQTVELQGGQTATVQFVGQTKFAAGDWIGVELESATGKNDGSVQGERYFECQPQHGMFVRPSATTILDQPTPKANGRIHPNVNGGSTTKRQSAVPASFRRQSVLASTNVKRQSINASSPTPGPKGLNSTRSLRSPAKSPTKQMDSYASSGNSTPLNEPLSDVRKAATFGQKAVRPSMGPPATNPSKLRSSRESIARPLNGSIRPTSTASAPSRATTNQLSMQPDNNIALGSVSDESHVSIKSDNESTPQTPHSEMEPPKITDVLEETSANSVERLHAEESVDQTGKNMVKPSSMQNRPLPSETQKPPTSNGALSRENEDLRTKLRVIEKRRKDDREQLKELGQVRAERDRYEGIIQKLQSKYQPQQQEVADLRKQLKETDAKIEALEKQQAENDTIFEMATLDREMAEETTESLKGELDMLKKTFEELQLEVVVLREENEELGKEMSPEERTSQGWLQMERSNERLREALMRLRDVTQEQEEDFRSQVAELESDLKSLQGAKEQQAQSETALKESRSTVEQLQEQLETALSSEEMIEELTEKNLALNEQVESLRAVVEELESLKELNDELEMNHTENAKQMQEEIDHNGALLADQSRHAMTQDQTIQDLDYTVERFRSLVSSMQTDLEEMRTSKQLTEAEANDLTSRSKAMMDLNMRLQSSASKAQIKAIDLELGKLDAQESAEHLEIIQNFLPKSFAHDHNSIRAYLRFKRIMFKADLLYGNIKDSLSTRSATSKDEDVFTACNILDKLLSISTTCNRFVKSIQSSDLESFAKLGGALFDLEPVERTFNGWIEAVKRDELKQEHCDNELSRTIALMTHLAEVHINDNLESYAADVHARALLMQGQLESALIALSHTKSTVESKIAESGADDDGNTGDFEELKQKTDSLVSQMRSAKSTAGKALRQLNEMQSRSLTLDPTTLPSIEQSQASITELSEATRYGGQSIFNRLNEGGDSTTLTSRDLISSSESPFSSLASKIQSSSLHLHKFYDLTATLNHAVEFNTMSHYPPWHLLAEKLASETITLASRENEIAKLCNEAQDKSTTLALRDKSLEELSVKLETLEKRASESGGRRERLRELENVIGTAKEREIQLVSDVNRLRSERNDLRTQRESWMLKPEANQDSSTVANAPKVSMETTSEASLAHISSLEKEINHLQAAIRHLRKTSYTHNISTAHDFLSKPLIPQISPQEQRARLKQSEAKSIVSELLRLASDPANGVPRLKERRREERLGWRPVRETCWWQVGRAKEEWEEWREWRDGFGTPRRKKRLNESPAIDLDTLRLDGSPNTKGEIKGVEENVKILGSDHDEDVDLTPGAQAV
ncbi:MAG: hypothetical protein Q9220_006571 [cf. Caloplaca sp. 1 TL-2023]